jgi:hypothetical protein
MLGSLSLWTTVIKYGLVAVVVGGATWWLLATVQRAREADQLEADLARERAVSAAKVDFEAKVEMIRTGFEVAFSEFQAATTAANAQRRENLHNALPSNTRVCLSRDVVRLLNNAGDRRPDLPERAVTPNADPDAPRITPGS